MDNDVKNSMKTVKNRIKICKTLVVTRTHVAIAANVQSLISEHDILILRW